MSKTQFKAAATVKIGADAGLSAMDEIHRTLVERLAAQSVALDLSEVGEADIAFAQLILVAAASARAEGKSLSLAAPAAGAVRNVLERGGLLGDAAARRFWLGEAV